MFRRRLPTSSLLALTLAVACGLGAILAMRGYAAGVERTRPVVGAPVAVLVAASPLTRGTTLAPSMLRASSVPSTFLPPGAVPAAEDVSGRTLTADIAEGEVLTQTRLAGTAVGPVAAIVPAGLRAFLVPTALAPDIVRVGDLVDVMAAFGGARPHVETVAQGLEIAGVLPAGEGGGAIASPAGPGGPTLVLLVTPDVASRLSFAVAFAKLSVAVDPAGGPEASAPTPTPVPAVAAAASVPAG
jgi:Flp pilus assembly protein CpaB